MLPKRWDRERAWLAVAATAVTLLAVWPLFAGGNQEQAFGGWLLLRVDELSRFVVLAAAIFATMVPETLRSGKR